MSETIPHSAEAYHPDGESYRDLWKLSHSNVGRMAKRANELRAERDKWKAEGEDVVQMLIQRDKEADAALAELAALRAERNEAIKQRALAMKMLRERPTAPHPVDQVNNLTKFLREDAEAECDELRALLVKAVKYVDYDASNDWPTRERFDLLAKIRRVINEVEP
jgi:seryl-tRNA synthetase